LNKYNEDLNRIFSKKYPKIINIVVFCEFLGENSFSGQHDPNDIKDVVLFDVSLYKKGIISPYEFVDNFGLVDIPKVVYEGEYNMDFINSVRNNSFGLKEGVVCKGVIKTKRKVDDLFFTKIKTNDWLIKVRERMGYKALLDELNGDMELLNELV